MPLDVYTKQKSIHSNAKYIVSQDKHFGILRDIDFPKLDVIDIDTFLNILGQTVED